MWNTGSQRPGGFNIPKCCVKKQSFHCKRTEYTESTPACSIRSMFARNAQDACRSINNESIDPLPPQTNFLSKSTK
jgi:hypothetical protein